jgi:integrase
MFLCISDQIGMTLSDSSGKLVTTTSKVVTFCRWLSFLLGFNTAFRIAELQRITWNMVLDGRVRLYTKGGARREVPISGQLREELMFIYKRSSPDRFWPVLHYPSHRRKEGSPVSVAGSIKDYHALF